MSALMISLDNSEIINRYGQTNQKYKKMDNETKKDAEAA